MHHLGTPLDAENEQDVARGLAADLLGVLGIVGNKSAANLVAVRPTHDPGRGLVAIAMTQTADFLFNGGLAEFKKLAAYS